MIATKIKLLKKYFLITDVMSILALALMMTAIYAIFVYVPNERVMGVVQRIFYIHLGLALVSFLAFFVVFISSICYLATKKYLWDIIAHASAEVGVIFCTLVLITGPLWAKPVWGAWWTWEPRLTTTVVLWLIYVAYLMLRAQAGSGSQRARFAAVFGIVGFIDVPIVFMSIRWWRSIHPVVIRANSMDVTSEMFLTISITVVATLFIYICLVLLRVAIGWLEHSLSWLQHNMA